MTNTTEPHPQYLRAWDGDPPEAMTPLSRGTNNRSYRVERADGHFILRVSRDAGARDRIAREAVLLRALQGLALPFQTPAPVPTATHEAFATVPGEPPTILTLAPVIPGGHARAGDARHASACGRALGRLGMALASLGAGVAASLPLWLPAPDFAAAWGDGIGSADRPASDAVRPLLQRLSRIAGEVNGRFPCQPIHGDYYPSNVLLAGGEVSGVLDFEYATRAPAALDLAIGLWTFGAPDGTFAWPALTAFAAGYAGERRIDQAEAEALPDLIRLREAISLLHWRSRYRQGLTTAADMRHRIDRLRQVDARITADGSRLVEIAGHFID